MIKPKMIQTVKGKGIARQARTADDINDLIIKHMNKAPKLTSGFVNKLARARRRQFLKRIQTEPGPPRYPIRWKSEKQRRYVMWLLRSTNNLPYKRTGRMAAAWEVAVKFTKKGAGGLISAVNEIPESIYVYGPDQQPYHADTGWPLIREAIADEANAFEEDLASAYVTLSDPYAGVRPESL